MHHNIAAVGSRL